MNTNLNQTFDSQFDKIENLTWYPWVGKDYALSNRRVLMIGDSHYTVDEEGNFDEECYNDFMSNKNHTREFAYGYMNGEEWNFNRNLRLCLLNVDDKTLLKPLWEKITFYNFIQEPMKQRDAEPTVEQYKIAWNVFVKLVEVIKPTDCIFIGVRSETGFGSCMYELGLKEDKDYYIKNMNKKINGTFPREAFIEFSDGYNLKLFFIKHTAKYFSPEKWHDFLKKEMPEAMNFLNS